MINLFRQLSRTGKLLTLDILCIFLLGLFADLGATGLCVASALAAVVMTFASIFSWMDDL